MRADISPLALLMKRLDAVADGAAPPEGIPTGFPSLDRALGGGLRRGDLIVLGGDVGVGKSALALAIALRAVDAGHAAEFVTGEMDAPRVLERALAIEGRASLDRIREGTVDEGERAALGAAALRLRDALPRLSRLLPNGPEPLGDTVAAAAGAGAALVIVDALQGVPSGRTPEDEEMAATMRLLKARAIEHQVAILLTAQLPRLVAGRADMRPVLADFGVHGAVQHDADVVLALFREEMYGRVPGHEGATELAILKNRGGAATYVDLFFYKQWLRFEDMVEPDR